MTFKKGNTYGKMNKGRRLSKETKHKKSISMKNFYKNNKNNKCGFQKNHKVFKGAEKGFFTTERSKNNKIRLGKAPWNKNKTKEELITHYKNGWKIKHFSKEEHWNWQGGKSYETYPREFKLIKYQIIEKQQICQLCQSDNNLVVHHIDKNKKNNDRDNLMVLCRRCHGKVHQGGLKI